MATIAAPARTDLVIGVTLAELFLLLMFVVWYGFSPSINQDPLARLKDENAKLRSDVAQLNQHMRAMNEQIADLKWRLDFWHNRFHNINERSPDALPSVARACKEECRSSPVCDHQQNILIDASVIHGAISVRILAKSPGISQWFANSKLVYPSIDSKITSLREIKQFLGEVSRYYSTTKGAEKECRFDYRLHYATNDDYHDGRVFFENFLYPAGIKLEGVRSKPQ